MVFLEPDRYWPSLTKMEFQIHTENQKMSSASIKKPHNIAWIFSCVLLLLLLNAPNVRLRVTARVWLVCLLLCPGFALQPY